MDSYFGLSEIEYEFMEFFWELDRDASFAEITAYCNTQRAHGWAATTIHTYLTRLIRKGVLDSSRNGYKRSYRAAVSKEELAHRCARKFVDESFHGSLRNLLVSLTLNAPLSQEDAAELHRILEENTEGGQ